MSENETIADIIAEMRSGVLSATIECEACGEEQEQRFRFDGLADRLEAAWRREELRWAKANGELAHILDCEKAQGGNAAAIREAAEKCVDLILSFGNAELDETPMDVIIDIEAILKVALYANQSFTEAAENVNSESAIDTRVNNAAKGGNDGK